MNHTLQVKGEGTLAVLGYSYGLRSFPFGGAWPEREAYEVAIALNAYLRNTPVAGAEEQLSATELRNARSSDF